MLLSLEHRFSHAWQAGAEPEPARWLRNTPALQVDHPRLQIQVMKLTQLRHADEEKAAACFQFIRGMPFKTVADPTVLTSADVLRARSGDSHTKGLLFVAMLRCLGIPARLRLVRLGPAFLQGLLSTDGRCVSHALTEVYLGARWMKVDAYCVDLQLGLAARARLLRDGRRMGYGVHMNGQIVWEGKGDALGCFSPNDPLSLPVQDLGVYDDPSHFAQSGLAPQMNWAEQARWSLSTALLNRRIKALRRSIRPPQPRQMERRSMD
jgi:hypothetical protein